MVETVSEPHIECGRCGRRFARADMPDHMKTHKRRHVDTSGDCRTCNEYLGGMMPPHDASSRCESGWRSHCSCDTCF